MLSLEASSNFVATSQGIQVCERNESKSFDKEQVKNQEAHIIETSKIKCHLEDVKANADLVDANTLKQVSPTNLHVSKITPQVLRITNNVLQVRLQLLKVLEVQASEAQVVSKVQNFKPQVLDIKIPKVQVSEIHISDIKLSKVHIQDVQVLDIKF